LKWGTHLGDFVIARAGGVSGGLREIVLILRGI
jgi:hypothetical protein